MKFLLILLKVMNSYPSDPISTDIFQTQNFSTVQIQEQTSRDYDDSEPEVLHFEIHQLCQFCNLEVIIDPYENIYPKFTDEQ